MTAVNSQKQQTEHTPHLVNEHSSPNTCICQTCVIKKLVLVELGFYSWDIHINNFLALSVFVHKPLSLLHWSGRELVFEFLPLWNHPAAEKETSKQRWLTFEDFLAGHLLRPWHHFPLHAIVTLVYMLSPITKVCQPKSAKTTWVEWLAGVQQGITCRYK